MRFLRTDNAGLRAKFIWFGDPDHPWTFEASGSAWIWAACLIPFYIWALTNLAPRPIIAAIIPGFLGYLLTGVAATVGGIVLGILTTRFVGRHVTPAEPVAHHVATLLGELNAPRDPGRRTTTTTVPVDLERKHRRTTTTTIPTDPKD